MALKHFKCQPGNAAFYYQNESFIFAYLVEHIHAWQEQAPVS